jgi:hypothetical protein
VIDDVARDARLVTPLLASALGPPPGVPLPDPYPDLPHARDWAAAVAACTWVTDEQAHDFVDERCLFGAPADIRRGLEERQRRFGIQKYLLHGLLSYDLPVELLDVAATQA